MITSLIEWLDQFDGFVILCLLQIWFFVGVMIMLVVDVNIPE